MKHKIQKNEMNGIPVTKEMMAKALKFDLDTASAILYEVFRSEEIQNIIVDKLYENYQRDLAKQEIENGVKEELS